MQKIEKKKKTTHTKSGRSILLRRYAMKKAIIAVLVMLSVLSTSLSFAGDWNLVKNVKRLERVSPDYQDDKDIDKKFLDVLDLTEKTKKESEVYDEAKRIAALSALGQSKYMDSFLYYMLVRSLSICDKMRPAIFLIATFCLLITDRPVFPIACDLQLRSGDAAIFEIALGRPGTLFTEDQVVGLRTALITMALDENVLAFVRTEPPGVLLHRLHAIGPDSEPIVIKVDVLEFAAAAW